MIDPKTSNFQRAKTEVEPVALWSLGRYMWILLMGTWLQSPLVSMGFQELEVLLMVQKSGEHHLGFIYNPSTV